MKRMKALQGQGLLNRSTSSPATSSRSDWARSPQANEDQELASLTSENGSLDEPALASGARFNHDFGRVPVFIEMGRSFQPNLRVPPQEDVYEQEADRVAEQVIRAPFPPPSLSHLYGDERSMRHNEQENQGRFQPQRVPSIEAGSVEVPAIVQEVISSPGKPLDSTTRSFMEIRLGHDFSHVRVHTDGRAAESAQAVNARAYTFGGDVFFARGEYNPSSIPGKKLLAHELTHVAQQNASSPLTILSPTGRGMGVGIQRQIADPQADPDAAKIQQMIRPAIDRVPRG